MEERINAFILIMIVKYWILSQVFDVKIIRQEDI